MRSPRRTALALALGLASVCCSGPEHHTVPPYRDDPAQAAQLEQRAADACAAAGHPGGPPARRFVTDGCSAFPDGDWAACCVEHDLPYWCGGTRTERAAADEALQICVTERSGLLARAMQLGVRVGGHPLWPSYWRWGYGRPWPAGYTDSD